MSTTADRRLFVTAAALSLALTGVTVWAVARQGRALQARERADLRSAAEAAARERAVALEASWQRALEVAALAWQAAGPDGLDAWVTGQREWLLAGHLEPDGTCLIFPRSPLDEPLPAPAAPATAAADARNAADPAGALGQFRQLAATTDPLVRAGALLAAAACEQQLGQPLAAARTFAEAAQLLRSTPGLARFEFRAELARVESLLAAGAPAEAVAGVAGLVRMAEAGHPARLGAADVARLAAAVRLLDAEQAGPLLEAIGELGQRAARRDALAAAMAGRLRIWAADPGTAHGAAALATVAEPEPLVLAVRETAEGGWLGVGVPARELLARYWPRPAPGTPWQVRAGGEAESAAVLVRLGPEFGGAVLEPSPEAAQRLSRLGRRQMGLVVATATGTAGGWALVLWMLGRAMARQRELVRLQRRFVADVSHELKTPLALIRLLAETLAGQRVRDPQRVQNYLETITRESERLSVLLDGILDFSRMQSGRKQYEFGACDVAAVARQAWALFEPQLVAEGFDARLELAPDLPAVRGDAQALQQVLVNLLQNAHRYAGAGKFIRLAAAREGHLVVLTVEDHGIGMTPHQLERLGDSFYRGDDTRVRQTRGAGLGLTIVSHIVAAHRGKLEVQSRPGQGSTFTVWIPAEPGGAEADGGPPGPGPSGYQ